MNKLGFKTIEFNFLNFDSNLQLYTVSVIKYSVPKYLFMQFNLNSLMSLLCILSTYFDSLQEVKTKIKHEVNDLNISLK